MKRKIIYLLILLIALISICTVSASTDVDNFNVNETNFMENSGVSDNINTIEVTDIQPTQNNNTNTNTNTPEITDTQPTQDRNTTLYNNEITSNNSTLEDYPTIKVITYNHENGFVNLTVRIQNQLGDGLANQTIFLYTMDETALSDFALRRANQQISIQRDNITAITDDEGYAHFINVNIEDYLFNIKMANEPFSELSNEDFISLNFASLFNDLQENIIPLLNVIPPENKKPVTDDEETNRTPITVKFTGTTFIELKNLIATLKNGDTIILDNDVYVDQDTKEDIKIYKSITIEGNGHKIDGKHFYRMFEVFSDNVVFNNITFINALTAIKWHNNKGTVNGCTFRNNKGNYGGALEWLGNDGNIENCTFINNEGNNGGALYITGDNCKVKGCTFQGNKGNNGGGLYITNCNSKLEGCTFQNNTAKADGGAICISGITYSLSKKGNKNIIIEGCTFQNNAAKGLGGGIYWNCYQGTARECKFVNNTAKVGAGIYWKTSHGNVEKCEFGYNNATGDGAAIYWYEWSHNSKITDCDFYKNRGKTVVTSKFEYMQYSHIDYIRCNFYFNTVDNVILSEGVSDILYCAFYKNTGKNIMDEDYVVNVNWCWFGNTKSDPKINMANVGGGMRVDNWYIINEHLTTSNPKMYYITKPPIKFAMVKDVKNCDLRLNRELLIKLIKES